jgi:hypothetical protein
VTAILLAVLITTPWHLPTAAACLQGQATYYAPGLMERVARTRAADLRGYRGAVALNRAGDLFRPVWLEWPDGQVAGPYLVVDCAQSTHYPERLHRGYVVEVSARVARARGFYRAGPAPVTVWFVDPAVLARIR